LALQEDVWQGKYGEDLVRALSSAAGLTTSNRDIDVDGVDLNIGFPGRLSGFGFPCIEVQIKSWKSPVVRGDRLVYPLRAHNFNLLVGRVGLDFPVPRLLMLVIVPKAQAQYVRACTEHYDFSHGVYWASLMDLDPVPDSQSTKTVEVPLVNLVTSDSLVALLSTSFRREAA